MAEISRDLFKKVQNIQIRTTQLATDLLAGAWHSAFKGKGMEFEEVREFQAGDDTRSVDWNVTARMHHPFVKTFREERELTVMLVVDISPSSQFGTQAQLKKDLIAEVGAVIAFSAIKNNDNVGLILFSDEVELYIPPKKGTRHVLRVIRDLLAFEPKGRTTNLKNALDYLGNILQKRSICFLISDFICKLPEKALSVISKKHDMVAISVTDPFEYSFPDMQLTTVKDLETSIQSTIDTSSKNLQAEMVKKTENRLNAINKLVKKMGAGFIDLRTDRPYLTSLRKFFKQREIRH